MRASFVSSALCDHTHTTFTALVGDLVVGDGGADHAGPDSSAIQIAIANNRCHE